MFDDRHVLIAFAHLTAFKAVLKEISGQTILTKGRIAEGEFFTEDNVM